MFSRLTEPSSIQGNGSGRNRARRTLFNGGTKALRHYGAKIVTAVLPVTTL